MSRSAPGTGRSRAPARPARPRRRAPPGARRSRRPDRRRPVVDRALPGRRPGSASRHPALCPRAAPPRCGSSPIDARSQRGLHPALTVKQQKSVGAPVLATPHAPPLDVLRLEQFLDLQQTLLAVAGDADALPERLVHAVAVFLGVEGTAVGIVEDGRYRLLATHGLDPAYRARFDGLAAHDEAVGAALAESRPVVLPAAGDTDPGPTLLLPFGTLAPPGDPSGALAGALHVIPPAAGLPDEDVNLAQAIAVLAGVALANARQAGRLARIARLKGDALSTMAHDLRAPLNALIGYTSLRGEGAFGALTEERPRLFEPFSAGDGRSTGFGLYIVRCLAEALGGRVAARREPGEGTAVTVELPLAAPVR